jgi:hypothetical protein
MRRRKGAMRGIIMKNVVRNVLVLSAIGTAITLGGCASTNNPPPPPPQAMDQSTQSQESYTAAPPPPPPSQQQNYHQGPRG